MNYKYLSLAVASVLALGACTEDAISPITGKYPKPEVYEMTTVLSQPTEKSGNNRIFTVELATEGVSGTQGDYQGTGAVLAAKFVGNKYFLHDAAYTASPAETAKVGNYLVGNNGSAFYTVNNGAVEKAALDHGSLTVLSDNGNYTITGTLWLDDETIVQIAGKVALKYEEDPEPVRLTKLLSAQSNVAGGNKSVTLNIATDGVEGTPNGFGGMNFSGNGNYLALDIYSEDGYLYPGTYKPCTTGGVINAGEYGIGWDPGDLWGIGMVFTDWGTCWWTVADGVTSAEKILEGEIVVEKQGGNYSITYNYNGLFINYTGKIEALDPTGGEETYIELTQVLSAQSNLANGTKSVTLNLATDGVAMESNGFGGYNFTGNGNYLALDIYSEDGTLVPGTYAACATGGAINAGEFGIGWDPGDIFGWGMEFTDWGTCWWTVTDGATSAEKVLDGTVTVAVEGENYVITLESSTANVRYSGPIDL